MALRIVVLRVGCAPVVEMVPGTLKSLQDIVGGYLQIMGPHDHNESAAKLNAHGIDAYVEDEGLYKYAENPAAHHLFLQLGFNAHWKIHGTVFFVGHDEDGNNKSLTDEQVAVIMQAHTKNYLF
jgi:hypothetical protein